MGVESMNSNVRACSERLKQLCQEWRIWFDSCTSVNETKGWKVSDQCVHFDQKKGCPLDEGTLTHLPPVSILTKQLQGPSPASLAACSTASTCFG